MKIALIGCGAIARRSHLPAFKKIDDVDVVAFASRSISSAEAACTDWGSGEVLPDWHGLLDRSDIDAVDICSPNAAHVDQTVAALKSGKHVLVEKPMACTTREADEMIAAADASGRLLQVAHNLRYLPAVVAARGAADRVGEIVGVRAAFGHAGPKMWAPDATWFFDPGSSGGGALIDLGIHAIDLVRFVTGLEVTEVTAMTFGSDAVEDAAQVVMRFANRSIGSLHASWVAQPAPDFVLTVHGREGTLHFDARTPLTFREATGPKHEIELPTDVSDPYADFVRAIRGEPTVGAAASAADGRAAVAIVDAAYESARTGGTVAVP